MKIIVGLGNIGDKYLFNRHNAGFLALDYFLHKNNIQSNWKKDSKFKAYLQEVNYKNEKILLVKPTTLMNRSGESVQSLINFYKIIPKEKLLIIFDEIDFPLGTAKFKEKGSAGTHNGMKSIIKDIGTSEFPRIRIGIESRGEIAPAKQDLSSFVLSNFLAEEKEKVIESFEETIKIIDFLLDQKQSFT